MRPFSLVYRPAVIEDDFGVERRLNLSGYRRPEAWCTPRQRYYLRTSLHRIWSFGGLAYPAFIVFMIGPVIFIRISPGLGLLYAGVVLLLFVALSPYSAFGRRLIRRRRIDIIRPILQVGICPCCVYDLRRSMTAAEADRTPYVTCPECGASWFRSRQWE